MSLADKIFGRPLASSEEGKQKLSVITGVPVLGLDALASTGYAGVGAVVSVIPSLYSHRLAFCLVVLATLTLVNLRGIRESGLTFIVPVLMFVGCIAVTILIGLSRSWHGGGNPAAVPAARRTHDRHHDSLVSAREVAAG